MSESKIQELSKNGLQLILEENQKEIKGIFQVLEYTEKKNMNNQIFDVTLSDGFSKTIAGFIQVNEFLEEKVKKFTIIQIEDGNIKKFKENKLFVSKFSILYDIVTSMIGEPLEYSEYKLNNFINHKGDSKIPLPYNAENTQIKKSPFIQENNETQKKRSSAITLKKNFEPNENFLSIKMLTPMNDNWRVKARIIKKYEKKTYNSAKGQGELLNIDILDIDGTEMPCTFFNKSCEKWIDVLNEGKTYIFSGGNVRINNKKFSAKSDYQIIFDEKTDIEEVIDDHTIIKQKFSFIKINKINEMPIGTVMDVVGIVKDSGMFQEITLKNSSQTKGRKNIQIYDDTLAGIEITLWGDLAAKELEKNSILIVKNAKINEFNNARNLTSSFQTSLITEYSTIPEALALLNWQNNEAGENIEQKIQIRDKTDRKMYRVKTLKQIEEDMDLLTSGYNNQDKLFSDIKVYITFFKNDDRTPLYYLSCQNEKCSKKVIEDSDGWRCETCNTTYKEPTARYILSAKVSDETNSIWINLFDSVGVQILGKTANEIKNLKEQGQTELINQIFKNTMFKYFKLKVMSKFENYNGESKIKHQVLKVYNKDLIYENKVIIDEIDEYLTTVN